MHIGTIFPVRVESTTTTSVTYSMLGPFFFMTCSLLAPKTKNVSPGAMGTALAGTLVSSLHKLKDGRDNNNADGAFFIFGDLSVKLEGWFQLQFNLYEMCNVSDDCRFIQSTVSEHFQVYPTKSWPGMNESTFLTRTFSDQGVRLRLRKEPRTLLKKRGPAHDDYHPRRYRKSQSSQQNEKESAAESDMQQNNLQSPSNRGTSTEQTYIQGRSSVNQDYTQQSPAYSDTDNYDDPPTKRPRTSSMHGHLPPLGQGISLISQQLEGSSMYPESQHPSYNYSQSPTLPSQGGNYSNFGFMTSPQISNSPRDQYFNRIQGQMGGGPIYDSTFQRASMILHNQHTSTRFPPTHYGVSTQSPSYPQDLTLHQRPELSPSSYEVFGYQTRPQPAGSLPNVMAPPMLGRLASPNIGALGLQNASRNPYQSAIVQNQNQNISAGSIGAMFSSSRVTTSMSTTTPPSLGSSYT
jgi:hypothetical protein